MSSDGLTAAFPATLFGFEYERVSTIEVNPTDSVAIIAMVGHHALECVIVKFARSTGRVGMRQFEHIAKFSQKQAVVGALLPALLALPASNKRFYFFG